MRATLNLDEQMVSELVKITGSKTKTDAIHMAMDEAIRARKLGKLKSLAGKIIIDPVWKSNRSRERKRVPHV
jgi:hypothetical protein